MECAQIISHSAVQTAVVCGAGSLMEAWRKSDWQQQNALLDQMAKVLQNISEQEAQELPNKDPDVPGMLCIAVMYNRQARCRGCC